MRTVGTWTGIRPPASWLAAPVTLWRFSRPHTLVGTTTSILGIYAIATAELPGVALGDGVADLALTLLAGAAVNVYIVGLNQCEDVEIDLINKPWLPIPAGRLGLRAAWRLVRFYSDRGKTEEVSPWKTVLEKLEREFPEPPSTEPEA